MQNPRKADVQIKKRFTVVTETEDLKRSVEEHDTGAYEDSSNNATLFCVWILDPAGSG
jgi:hypothetical protein